MDNILQLRNQILSANGCSFRAEITADYGETIQTFTLSCDVDSQGNLNFTVVLPETISGIAGKISEKGGNLKFNNEMLAFPLLADGQLSPVSAPWIFMRALRSGYIVSGAKDEEYIHATISDSYANDALQLEIWFNEGAVPVQGEIIWGGKRILTLVISDFVYM